MFRTEHQFGSGVIQEIARLIRVALVWPRTLDSGGSVEYVCFNVIGEHGKAYFGGN
jgi:hypothetical protein